MKNSSSSGKGERKWEEHTKSKRRHKKYPKHEHYDEEESISHDGDKSYPRLPPSDPAKVTKLQGQLQNDDLFPFSLEEGSDDEAFLAAFNDSGDEGTNLRRFDRDGFNEVISCPSLAARNPDLPDETFEQRAKKRGRDSAALQLALRLFCRNYEQHYGSLVDQRLVDFPPTLTPRIKQLKESSVRDAFQCTKMNALFRAEQFEYENPKAIAMSTTSEKDLKAEDQHPSMIDPTAWSGVRSANKEIEGILLQRLLWKILIMAAKRIHRGGGPQSLEEQFVQSQWDAIVTFQTDELRYRSDIQDLVFEYITCLLGEEYQLGPSFSGRIYDYSVSSSSIRMLDSLTSANEPSSIQNDLREKALCPVAMRVLYLFSETSDNKANEKQGATMKANEIIPPPEERVKYFKKQRKFLRNTTPGWKSKGKYLTLKEVVKPIRARLSVSEAAPDVNILSSMLAVENTRNPKYYALDYDQIWVFSRELPTYSKVRNFFSLKFYDGVLREDVMNPWDDESEYEADGVTDHTLQYNPTQRANSDIDPRIPYSPPPRVQSRTQVWLDGQPSDESVPEVGSGQIMPLPLIDFNPEKLQARQAKQVKRWKVAKYYPGCSLKLPLPETGFIEAAMGARIQTDLDERESKINNGEWRRRKSHSEDVTTRQEFKLPKPKPIWSEAPNYPIKVAPRSRGIGRGRQVVPLVPLSTQHSTVAPAVSTHSAQGAEKDKRKTRKEYKRALPSPTTTKIRRIEKTQPLQHGEGREAPATTNTTINPPSKPTVSVEKRHEIRLSDYKPVSPRKVAKARKLLREREKSLHASSPPIKEKQKQKLRQFESSLATTNAQYSPKSRIVGTGYHHLPASDKPFSSTSTGPSRLSGVTREEIKGVNPFQSGVTPNFTPNITESMPQVNPLYPWLRGDRGQMPLKNWGVAFKERYTPSDPHKLNKGKGRAKKDKHVQFEEE